MRRLLKSLVLRGRGDLGVDALRKRGLRVGRNLYLGQGARLDNGFLWLIAIGDDVTISPHATILVHDAATKRGTGYSQLAPVTIGDGVYIGAGAIVLPGASIGDGAIVGAGSVVRRDVAAGTIVAGNPARVIGQVDEFIARHRSQLATRPCYPAAGWTYARGITRARQDQMYQELRQRGGYIE